MAGLYQNGPGIIRKKCGRAAGKWRITRIARPRVALALKISDYLRNKDRPRFVYYAWELEKFRMNAMKERALKMF